VFKFKFEKMIKIKESILKKSLLELASIDKMIKLKKEEKNRMEIDNQQRRKKLNNLLKKDNFEKNMLVFVSENIQRAERRIAMLEREISSLNIARTKKLDEILFLNMEKKKLEKLKSKEYERYLEEENKSEMRFLNEIANIRSANRILRN